MDIVIKRVATPDNISDNIFSILHTLDTKCFVGETPYPKVGSYWWLAYVDDEPIAFAGMTVYDYIKKPAAFLSRAGVLPKARGNGIQKRLIRARERAAKKIGQSRIITYTSYDNLISANNLIKCGYTLYLPDHWWGIKNGLYFEKLL